MRLLRVVNEIVDDREKKASILIGRFQPFHVGHVAAIKKAAFTPVIVLVSGRKSSKNKAENPLNVDYRVKLIRKVFPSIHVTITDSAFLPRVIERVERETGLAVAEILGARDEAKGENRADEYRQQLLAVNRRRAAEGKELITVERFTLVPRLASSTEIREAIRGGDKTTFLKLMPAPLHGEWVALRELLTNVSEACFIDDLDLEPNLER